MGQVVPEVFFNLHEPLVIRGGGGGMRVDGPSGPGGVLQPP